MTGPAPLERFQNGCVIPAHPLALDSDRRLDERRQRALSRYYLDAGSGGLAVAVHTTQFAVHTPEAGLLQPVLELAADVARKERNDRAVLVAGVVGPTEQALAEAELARDLGYDLAMLIPYGTGQLTDGQLIARARAVGEVLPTVGFYLQPAVDGRVQPRAFWRQLASLDTLVGIKVAAFNRYATLDVMHGVRESGRADHIALYTGNDDHIVSDLVTAYGASTDPGGPLNFVGGLLGQWSVWTRRAVALLGEARRARLGDDAALRRVLAIETALTDANGALFDVAANFHGCIAGVHEALRRQGLLEGRWCLDPAEDVSPGQLDEINRVWLAYPFLRDDDFVQANLDRWLA